MADTEADFLKLELHWQFLEAAVADTTFVASHLLKELSAPLVTGAQRRELEITERQLRTLLHRIRACAQREIETEAQVRDGQRLYRALLHELETAARDFADCAAASAASLPPDEQVAVQASLTILRSFREDFPALQ